MTPRCPEEQLGFVRKLRREMSTAETILWRGLRGRGIGLKFRRHVPIRVYVADLVGVDAQLMVEVDGPAHDRPERQSKDESRDEWLRRQGWRILRFSDDAVIGGCDLVIARIRQAGSRGPSSDPATPGHLLPLARE